MKAGNPQISPEANMPWGSIWQHPLSPSPAQEHMYSKQGGKKWNIKVIKFTPCGVCSKGCIRIQLEGIWGKAGAPTLPVQTDCSSLWSPTQMPLGDRRRLAGYVRPVQAHAGVPSAYIRHLENQCKCKLCFREYTIAFVPALILNIVKWCWFYWPLCPPPPRAASGDLSPPINLHSYWEMQLLLGTVSEAWIWRNHGT